MTVDTRTIDLALNGFLQTIRDEMDDVQTDQEIADMLISEGHDDLAEYWVHWCLEQDSHTLSGYAAWV